ncbi:uncharacterized protein LOC110752332 [Prunus avium]|uniref:Uncharacterized protein LOC110752332 n=1 Tax=Prunus avium TaxID=42229 RepID=A0A6P5S1V7_PRUAV|nr:uncharacterized protein LOC110752332 [Prunus avium]
MNNIVIVIKRSDYGGEGKRRPRVILACERSGNYKSCKSSETTDIRSDVNSDMKTCARDTGAKKCGCPFLLKCVNIGDRDDWKLEVVCGVHNHPISEYLQGHSFVGRLSQEENALLVDMSKSLVKPRDILVTLKDRDAMNVSTMTCFGHTPLILRFCVHFYMYLSWIAPIRLIETEEEYWRCLRQIESKFSEFQKALEYIHYNWLNPFKDRFVAAWTDTCMHLGSTTSNRFRHPELRELVGFVSIKALSVIVCELERLEIDGVDTLSCGCTIRRTHQLPYAHEIAEYRDRDVPIPLDVVHSHWRKLDLINIRNSSHGTTSPGRSQLQRFNIWNEQQDDEKKRQVHMTLKELMNPGSTALTEPKGRPRKVDTSTCRLPSAFEIAEASTALPKNKPKQSLTASLKIKPKKSTTTVPKKRNSSIMKK